MTIRDPKDCDHEISIHTETPGAKVWVYVKMNAKDLYPACPYCLEVFE